MIRRRVGGRRTLTWPQTRWRGSGRRSRVRRIEPLGRAGRRSYRWRLCHEGSAYRPGMSSMPIGRRAEAHRPRDRQRQSRDQPAVPQVRERVVRRAILEQPGFLTGSRWRDPDVGNPIAGLEEQGQITRRHQTGEKVPEPRSTGVPTSSTSQARAASPTSSLIETHRRPSAVSQTATTLAGVPPS